MPAESPATAPGLGGFVKSHLFLIVASVLALASCFVVRPSREYLHYFEPRTLVSLFCFLAVVRALENAHVINELAEVTVRWLRSRRALIIGLVFLALVASMLITNDMALIAFLPLAYTALKNTGNLRYLAFTFVMMAVAANLGGMITPFGSPQNLYLYQQFHIPFLEFLRVMSPPFLISVVLILAVSAAVRSKPVTPFDSVGTVDVRRAVLYALLFGIVVAIVLRVVPVWSGAIVIGALLLVDRAALRSVDYGLMLTFVAFFLLTGNIKQIHAVDTVLSDVLDGRVLVLSALASQFISNVPTAFLFAPFTDNYQQLLVGVNIGGVGTVIASLASLIALRHYNQYQPGESRRFMRIFSIINFGFLAVLLVSMQALFASGAL
ncbi:hypothetical protein GOARA_013_00090 [Gordonia araii NBRC 100433]|uniref:Citrate transporter-like domain-containing protein n=1 Tax=Gordonia araii NBRC 100433 TaxID=1073574 RepID=G7GY90_9ACTN|nr:SLC13 family permease [Gordonia araii]NNG97437.1 citrate transporter [Gordonia araii NBRC 100433]GAB08565.1 hypothetical protein GOARA_013_00090 [Gordonia araii NBRC 100433]